MKVSVIIPVYNVSAYIERCLKSVMNQTYNDIECVIVDDDSPDDSILKCERLIADYHGLIQFSILHHQTNRGLSAARNTGIDAANGDYVYFMDSDDELTPDCIEKLVRPVLRDQTIEMVQGNRENYPDGCEIPTRYLKRMEENDMTIQKDIRELLFVKKLQPISAWNKLIKRDFLNRYNLYFIEGLLHEDRPWMFFVLKHLSHLYIVPDTTYLHYLRPQSISTNGSFKVNGGHFAVIYETISSNLTVEESAIETHYYIREFCGWYMLNSHNQAFTNSA